MTQATNNAEKACQEMRAHGWKVSSYYAGIPSSCHMIYVRDFRYKHEQVFSIEPEVFDSPKLVSDVPMFEFVNFIAALMKKLAKKKTLNADDKNGILPSLTNYIKRSKNFSAWKEVSDPDARLHFIINVYNDSGRNVRDPLLRPFFVNVGDGAAMLTYQEFMDYTTICHQTDKDLHPEWFR